MPFYGFTPQAKSFAGIGAAATQLGAGISAGGQQIETKRAEAVKAAENWEDMEGAIKGIRANYKNYGNKLVDSGAISQEQFQAGLDNLTMPTRLDQKNPEAYIIKMEERVANAYKIFAGKEDILLKTQKTEARQQQATQFGQKVAAPPAPPEVDIDPSTGQAVGGTETMFEEPDVSREQAVSQFAAGTEGFQPTTKETAQFEKGQGQQFAPAEKPVSQFEKDKFQLQKDKFAWDKQKTRIGAKPQPKDYDKVLQTTIGNKNKAFGLSARYDSLIKATKQAIKKAEGGVIDQLLGQRLVELGYDGPMDVPSLEESLNQMEQTKITADQDVKFYEQQLKEIGKTERPTQLGTFKAATEKVEAQRQLPDILTKLENIRGFAYYEPTEPKISKTGEINISHPEVQEKIIAALNAGMDVDEIARQLQASAAKFIGTQTRTP